MLDDQGEQDAIRHPVSDDPPSRLNPQPAREQRLRILSYNIQVGIASSRFRHYLTHGWKHVLPYHGRQANLDAIAHFLSAFDLVGLQEVDAGSIRTHFVNQAEYLAERAGFPHWTSQTNRNLGALAQHSLGLLSRFRPTHIAEHRLPGVIPGRGALEVHYGSNGDHLAVILLHLSLGKKARARQLQYVGDLLADYEHVVVMGDLNTPPHSHELRDLVRQTRLREPASEAHTYPSWQPARTFDHVLVTSELAVEKTHVYRVTYSDHLPVGVDVRLPEDLHLSVWGGDETQLLQGGQA